MDGRASHPSSDTPGESSSSSTRSGSSTTPKKSSISFSPPAPGTPLRRSGSLSPSASSDQNGIKRRERKERIQRRAPKVIIKIDSDGKRIETPTPPSDTLSPTIHSPSSSFFRASGSPRFLEPRVTITSPVRPTSVSPQSSLTSLASSSSSSVQPLVFTELKIGTKAIVRLLDINGAIGEEKETKLPPPIEKLIGEYKGKQSALIEAMTLLKTASKIENSKVNNRLLLTRVNERPELAEVKNPETLVMDRIECNQDWVGVLEKDIQDIKNDHRCLVQSNNTFSNKLMSVLRETAREVHRKFFSPIETTGLKAKKFTRHDEVQTGLLKWKAIFESLGIVTENNSIISDKETSQSPIDLFNTLQLILLDSEQNKKRLCKIQKEIIAFTNVRFSELIKRYNLISDLDLLEVKQSKEEFFNGAISQTSESKGEPVPSEPKYEVYVLSPLRQEKVIKQKQFENSNVIVLKTEQQKEHLTIADKLMSETKALTELYNSEAKKIEAEYDTEWKNIETSIVEFETAISQLALLHSDYEKIKVEESKNLELLTETKFQGDSKRGGEIKVVDDVKIKRQQILKNYLTLKTKRHLPLPDFKTQLESFSTQFRVTLDISVKSNELKNRFDVAKKSFNQKLASLGRSLGDEEFSLAKPTPSASRRGSVSDDADLRSPIIRVDEEKIDETKIIKYHRNLHHISDLMDFLSSQVLKDVNIENFWSRQTTTLCCFFGYKTMVNRRAVKVPDCIGQLKELFRNDRTLANLKSCRSDDPFTSSESDLISNLSEKVREIVDNRLQHGKGRKRHTAGLLRMLHTILFLDLEKTDPIEIKNAVEMFKDDIKLKMQPDGLNLKTEVVVTPAESRDNKNSSTTLISPRSTSPLLS